jgi:hypothetical protein
VSGVERRRGPRRSHARHDLDVAAPGKMAQEDIADAAVGARDREVHDSRLAALLPTPPVIERTTPEILTSRFGGE